MHATQLGNRPWPICLVFPEMIMVASLCSDTGACLLFLKPTPAAGQCADMQQIAASAPPSLPLQGQAVPRSAEDRHRGLYGFLQSLIGGAPSKWSRFIRGLSREAWWPQIHIGRCGISLAWSGLGAGICEACAAYAALWHHRLQLQESSVVSFVAHVGAASTLIRGAARGTTWGQWCLQSSGFVFRWSHGLGREDRHRFRIHTTEYILRRWRRRKYAALSA